MCVKIIASQRWGVFLRDGVDDATTGMMAQQQWCCT